MNFYLYTQSFFLGIIGAWFVLRYGDMFGLMDHSNHRSSHTGITPKGGGIGILTAFILLSVILKVAAALWVSATIISLISLIGDRKELSPKLRLPIQLIAAFSFLLLFPDLPAPLNQVLFKGVQTGLSFTLFSILISIFFVLFIVATANWYNFMDGINGIAGITAIVAFGLLAFFNHISQGDNRLTVLPVCIVFACLGFLPFNFPKAKVFMGDVGSILLGFVFAAFVVLLSKNYLDFVCLAGFLFPFYADEFVTMAVRLKDGENLLKAHRRHFYQLLANEMGFEHWKVSIGYGLLQLIVGLSVLLVKPAGVLPVIILLSVFFAVFIFLNYIVRMKIGKRCQ